MWINLLEPTVITKLLHMYFVKSLRSDLIGSLIDSTDFEIRYDATMFLL